MNNLKNLKQTLKNKEEFNKIIIYGLIIVWFVIGIFPFVLYLNYQDNTKEVNFYSYLNR
jgi:hypothetical protein